MNYWLMIPLVCLFGALQGMFVEWIGVRPAIKIKSEFGWIMSTIALAIIFKNVAENIWGKDDLKFPSPLPSPHGSWAPTCSRCRSRWSSARWR
jgi:branched-chain amino acid transport system permease protein